MGIIMMLYSCGLVLLLLPFYTSAKSTVGLDSEELMAALKTDILKEIKSQLVAEALPQLQMELRTELRSIVVDVLQDVLQLGHGSHNSEERKYGHKMEIQDEIKLFMKQEIKEEIKLTMAMIKSHQSDACTCICANGKGTLKNYPYHKLINGDAENRLNGGLANVIYASSSYKDNTPTNSNRTKLSAHGHARRLAGEHVAFTAFLDHTLDHLIPEHTIKFNKVLLNEGNAYNIHTGVFTAPVSGVYLFSFHFVVNLRQTNLRLVVDDIHQVAAVTSHSGGTNSIGDGNMAVLRLTEGQAVWVETYYRYMTDQEINGADKHRETTFSGVLLY